MWWGRISSFGMRYIFGACALGALGALLFVAILYIVVSADISWAADDSRSVIRVSPMQEAHLPNRNDALCADSPLELIRALPHREDLVADVCASGRVRKFAEVGVKAGWFAQEVIRLCEGLELYVGVDLWRKQKHYDDGANVEDDMHEVFYEMAVNNTRRAVALHRPYAKVTLHREPSIVGAELYADNFFDMIYLDARHDFASVAEDILAWWPKLRCGGILSGHDYFNPAENFGSAGGFSLDKDGNAQPGDRGVRAAVEAFSSHVKRQVVVTYNDLWEGKPYQTWALRK